MIVVFSKRFFSNQHFCYLYFFLVYLLFLLPGMFVSKVNFDHNINNVMICSIMLLILNVLIT